MRALRAGPISLIAVLTVALALLAGCGGGAGSDISARDGCGYWSPDGSTVAFTRASGVYEFVVRTRELRRLAHPLFLSSAFLGWSHDGQRVVLWQEGRSQGRLISVGVATAKVSQLLELPLGSVTQSRRGVVDVFPSPDQTHVVEERYIPGPDGAEVVDDRFELWLRQIGENSARLLTANAVSLEPVWSPDSSQIAFSVTNTLSDLRSKVIVADLPSGTRTPVGHGGQWLAFSWLGRSSRTPARQATCTSRT